MLCTRRGKTDSVNNARVYVHEIVEHRVYSYYESLTIGQPRNLSTIEH